MRVLSLTVTPTASTGIWHSAGVTKGVTTPAAHGGIWRGAGATKTWFFVIQLSRSCRISLICRQLRINSVCSFFGKLTQVVVDSSWFKTDEFFHKMAISSKNCLVEQKNHSSLANWHDLPFIGDHWLRLLDIWSVHLCILVSLPQSKTRLQKAFFPNAGALSL